MYAVFASGGKQYRATPGDRIKVEKLDVATGETVALDRVMLIADGDQVEVGAPFIEGGQVEATVIAHGRGPKIHIVKFRRRKHYRKRMGHRQWYTELEINAVNGQGPVADKASTKKKTAAAPEATAAPAGDDAPAKKKAVSKKASAKKATSKKKTAKKKATAKKAVAKKAASKPDDGN